MHEKVIVFHEQRLYFYAVFSKTFKTLKQSDQLMLQNILNTYCDNFNKNINIGSPWPSGQHTRFNPSADGRRAGLIPVVALGVVCLSLVLLKISCGYPIYGNVLYFLALFNAMWCIGFMRNNNNNKSLHFVSTVSIILQSIVILRQ